MAKVARPHVVEAVRHSPSTSLFLRLIATVALAVIQNSAFAGVSASPNPSTDGDYTVSWTSITGADDYKLFESSDGGTNWTQIYLGPNLSKSITGKAPGTYKYDLDYCFWWDLGGPPLYNCVSSGYTILDVDVEGGPAIPLNLTGHDFDFDGEYDISWDSAEGADDYELEEKIGTGSWTNVYDGTSTSASLTKTTTDPHEYRVRGCDSTECSDWSATHVTEVEILDNIEDEVSLATASAAGTTPFSSGVDGKGNAYVNVPIQLPPGVNKMAPSLMVSYSSGASPALKDDQLTEGTIGYGWAVTGVSQISRCRAGIGGSINFTSTDGWCLDGDPLIRTSGANNMSDNAEFRTGQQSFLKISAKGTGLANRYFEAETPSGRTITFGDTDESRVIADGDDDHLYLLTVTKYKDEFGNEILYTWEESNTLGTNYLTEIEYDGTYVIFEYGERCSSEVNCDVSLVQGGENVPGVEYRGVVLNRIRTKIDTTWVSDYRLDSNYVSGYLRLEQFQHCAYNEAGSSYECMEPLEFAWDILTISRFDDDLDQNVVEKVTNAFGDETEFAYAVINGTGASDHSYHVDPPSWFGTYSQPSNLEKQVGLQRAIVDWTSRPDGKGGDAVTYFSYQGYPLYNTQGRGFAGFPSTRSDFLYRNLFNPSTDSSFDSTERTHTQFRLDFPFIGKVSREIRSLDIDSTAGEDFVDVIRSEYGWESKSILSGVVKFPYIRRMYVENNELDSSQDQILLSAKEIENEYCFRDLQSGDCPSTGTENDYPTQMYVTTRQAEGIGAQGFGSTWGEVADRSITNQLHHEETIADFENNVSGTNWVLGFISDVEHGFGTTSVSLTEDLEFEKETTLSLKIGEITRMPSDASHELTQTYDYDTNGYLTSTTVEGVNVASRTTTASLIEDHRYPGKIANAEGHETTFAYDLRFGLPKTITDPNNDATTVSRDGFGRIESVESPDGTTVETTYADCQSGCSMVTWATPRMKVLRTITNGTTKVAPDTTNYIDAVGNIVLIERDAYSSSDGVVRIQVHYDDVGNITKRSLPYYSIGGTAKFIEQMYDIKGRPVYMKRPDGEDTTTEITASSGELVIETEESESSNKKQSKFNSLYQLTATTDALGSTDAITTTYTYTARRKLDTISVDGTEVADIDYFGSGFRSSIEEPNTGTTAFLYDALGQILQSTDGESQKTRYSHDKLGRITQRIDGYQAAGAITNSWTWDGHVNGKGMISKRVRGDFEQEYTYTSTGKLDEIDTTIDVSGFCGSCTYEIDHDYDLAGRLESIAYPNFTADYVYSTRGFLAEVKDGTTSLHEFNEVDAFGNITEEAFANGIETVRTYDANTGTLTSIETGESATPKAVQDLLFDWKSNGVLASRTDERGTGSTSDDFEENFVYDTLNRLKTATESDSNRILSFTYDSHSNLKSKTSNTTGDLDVTSYTYSATEKPHRLTSATIGSVANTIDHDLNGNITRYDAATGDDTYIEYDQANYATKVTVGSSSTDITPTARDEFWHGPDGFRYLRKATWMNGSTLETSWTVYLVGGRFEEVHPEYDSAIDFIQRVQVTEAVSHRFIDDGTSTSEDFEYIHRDHLGTVDVITDDNGDEIRNLSFDAFGSRRASDWSTDADSTAISQLTDDADGITGRGFTSHEHLNRTGLIHMNGRIYDPRIGRFLQADPYVAVSFAQDFNRYSYGFNNPLSVTDPTGLVEVCLNLVIFSFCAGGNDGGGGINIRWCCGGAGNNPPGRPPVPVTTGGTWPPPRNGSNEGPVGGGGSYASSMSEAQLPTWSSGWTAQSLQQGSAVSAASAYVTVVELSAAGETVAVMFRFASLFAPGFDIFVHADETFGWGLLPSVAHDIRNSDYVSGAKLGIGVAGTAMIVETMSPSALAALANSGRLAFIAWHPVTLTLVTSYSVTSALDTMSDGAVSTAAVDFVEYTQMLRADFANWLCTSMDPDCQ